MTRSPSKIILGVPPFLDAAVSEWAEKEGGLEITAVPVSFDASYNFDLAGLGGYSPTSSTVFIALGDQFLNIKRYEIFLHVKKAGFSMPPLVSSRANIASGVESGENVWIRQGAFIAPGVLIGSNTVVGFNTALYANSSIGENNVLHDGAVIGAGSTLAPFVTIGCNVTLADGCNVGPFSRLTKPGIYHDVYHEGTFIEDRFEAAIRS